MNNIERIKQVYFELYSKELNRQQIEEPRGWSEDFLSFEKDKESKDIRKKVEIDLEFFGLGSDYLQNLYYSHGVGPTCLILKYEKSTDSINETWNLAYVQRIDLTTFNVDRRNGKVTVKAYEGGLFDLIKNRYDDEIDLLTEFSLDGDYIGPLKTHKFMATERKIFLQSLLKGDYTRYRIGSGYWASEAYLFSGRPIPIDIVYKSDAFEDIRQPTLVLDAYNSGRSRHVAVDPAPHFPIESDLPVFFEAEEPKDLQISLKGTFQITEFEERYVENTPMFYVRCITSYRGEDGLQKMKEGGNVNIIEIPIKSNIGSIIEVDWSADIHLEEGESVSLIYATWVSIDSSMNPFQNGYANTWVNSNMAITIRDVTVYPPRIARAIKPIDLFDRIVAKITGKVGLVRSNAFGEGGEFEFKMVDNGFFARGFPDKYLNEDGEEIAIQLKTSFKDAFDSFSGITPMCWSTQKEGNLEVVRVEPELYALDNFIGIRFEAADAISEKASPNDMFSKIELGHDGSLEYEEVNGLDEPNGKSLFSTPLGSSLNRVYSKVSKYRFDSMGYELTRRVSFDRFPYEDTERDEDIWIHDAKLQGDLIVHRSWHDDFEEAPKGIFDPDSAWNLRHSPMNLLLRGHGHAVRRCLYHDVNKYIRFSSSNSNQNLVTFPEENFRLEDSGELQIHNLRKQRIKADIVTMTVKVTPEIRAQLEGVNDKGVKNVFGLVEYPDKGVKKYGRIVKLSSGESSKLELIKAGI